MKKNFLFALLIFLAISFFLLFAKSVHAFSGVGAGTSGDPYQITTCEQLQEMSNATTSDYILMNDIDCAATTGWNGGAGFIPVGGPNNASFTGVLNGQNHVISNLFMSPPSSTAYVGLFGSVGNSGEIYNFGLVNPTIYSYYTGSSNVGTGAIVGTFGYIADANQLFVSGGIVSSTGGIVGGLFGNSNGRILNSYASTTVRAGSSWSGGLLGVFPMSLPVSNTYSFSNVISTGNSVGGIGGGDMAMIYNSFAAGTVTGNSNVGGIIGRSYDSTASNIYRYQYPGGPAGCYGLLQSGSFACTARDSLDYFKVSDLAPMTSWDFDTIWAVDGYHNNGLPYLQWQNFDSMSSTPGTQAQDIVFSSVAEETATISWTNGNGNIRTVFLVATTSVDSVALPVDETTYTANRTYGSGEQIGSTGWYLVYKGTSSSINVSGLSPNVAYRAHVVEFNGGAGSEHYLTSALTNNIGNFTTPPYYTPTTTATNVVFGNVSGHSATVSWTSGNGSNRVVFMKLGSDNATSSPTDNTTYTANSTFGSGTQIGSTGWRAVYKGTGTSVSVSNLSYASSYQVHVVEYNGTATNEKYATSAGTGNPYVKSIYAGTTVYSNSSTGNDTTGNGSTSTPYQSFHKAYTMAVDGDTVNLTGTFDWANGTGESGDGSGGYTISKDLTVTGQKASETFIQAEAADNTATKRIFNISSNYLFTLQNLTVRYGKYGSGSGGCISVNSGASLTLDYVDVYSCRLTSASYYGGGIYITSATTTINSSSIRGNVAVGYGGGLYSTGSASRIIITNSTLTGNMTATSSASYMGGAIDITAGSAWLTNVTIASNTSYKGALAASGGTTYFKNTLIADNSAIASTTNNVYKSSGTFTSAGYNIIGQHTAANFTTTTGDWTDADGDGTYTLYGGGSGTLSLSATAEVNDTYGTYTHALQGGIGINSGTSTAHTAGSLTVSIPSTDQRGFTRDSTPDIGAYELSNYTLTYIAGNGGSITGSSTQTVSYGDNGSTVTGTPNTGYLFSNWSDGVLIAERTDTNVSSSISVTANFIVTTNTVSYIASTGGSITGSSTQVIDYVSSTTEVVATPDTGYLFVSWSDANTSTSRTDANITTSTSYTASFIITTSTLTYTAGTHGVITGSSTQIVDYGANGSQVVAVPDTEYSFVTWSDANTSTSRTDTNITTSSAYTASFTTTTFTLTYSATAHGSITGSSTQTIFYGENGTAVTAVPDAGYRFVSWGGGNTSATRMDTAILANASYTATFALLNAPDISGASSPTASTSSVTISWTTDLPASSQVVYGPSTNYGLSTEETDTSTRVESHSVSLSSLANCSIYYYKVVSANVNNSYTTSTEYNFTTTGCVGSSEITSSTVSSVATSTTNTITLGSIVSGNGIRLEVPAGYSSTTTNFQIHKLVEAAVEAIAGTPAGFVEVGDKVYNLTAIADDLSEITSFDQDLTLTISYTNSEITGLDESSLAIFYWTGSAWSALSGCTVDTSSNTVACNTSHFTTFGLFGQEAEEDNTTPTTSGGGSFIPPSTPKVVVAPVVSGDKIIFSINNAVQMAISDNPNFSGSSWQKYNGTYTYNTNKTLYIKFRSNDGGVSAIFTVGEKKISKTETDTSTSINKYIFKRDLKLKMSGSDVKELQKYLNSNGFLVDTTGVGSPGKESAYFGLLTQKALIKFQQSKELSAFGILDSATRNYLNSGKAEPILKVEKIIQDYPAKTTSIVIFSRNLELGMSGEDVKALQKYLNNQGFPVDISGAGSPGKESTYFGLLTQKALIEFQKVNNIKPTMGYFGPMTRKIINK